jgi:hypothetical protein
MSAGVPIALCGVWISAMVPASGEVSDLVRRYKRDDQRLDSALRYERTGNGVREQVWALETGDVIKVAVETAGARSKRLDELSLDEQGNVYFSFLRVVKPQPKGGTRLLEERSYFEDSQLLQRTRRRVDLPAGAAAEFPAKSPTVKLTPDQMADEAGGVDELRQKAEEVIGAVRVPGLLVSDPASNAPEEWKRVKLVAGTLSPDGRHALAWAPARKDFEWKDYRAEESTGDYWMDGAEDGDVVNFIADLKTHRVAGKTPGVHFGTRRTYNHFECVMAWSPDSRAFIQLNNRKWDYAGCCIGRVTDGKVTVVEDLGKVVEARAGEFLKKSGHAGYLKNSGEMAVYLSNPGIGDDGGGSIRVTFQVPKSEDEDAYAEVRVRFRLTGDPARLEITDTGLLKAE